MDGSVVLEVIVLALEYHLLDFITKVKDIFVEFEVFLAESEVVLAEGVSVLGEFLVEFFE